jgi:hypothetical protein
MTHLRSLAVVVAVLMVTCVPVAAQDPPPAGAFRAVHLVNLTPQQVSVLQAWMADMNATIAKAGHKDVRYRLYKVTGKQAGPYEYMWESSWPSGEVYRKIHENPSWKAVGSRHPEVGAVLKEEIYNRYVEVTEKR